MRVKHVLATGVMLMAAAAGAQPSGGPGGNPAGRAPFTGAYAGPEAGLHEHHFYLNVTDLRSGETKGRYYRGWGIGGGAFIGYDFPVSTRLRGGVEAGVSLGGNNPVARFADGTDFTQHPRYGYRAAGKVGYLLSDRLMAYGTLGYGGHRYRLGGTATVSQSNKWGSSFTIGAGFEYQASDRTGVRLDFRHLDNQMSHLLIGVPVRF
jgi:outer membrane immunogenic protein